MKQSFRINGIVLLNSPRGMLSQVDDIKAEIKDQFLYRFKELWGRRLEILGVNFNHLSMEDCIRLKDYFCIKDITKAIWLSE